MIRRGFSLFEVLVVLFVFSLLAVLTTQVVFLTLRKSRKSEASIKVRTDLNYVLSSIERQIRNATSITCPTDQGVNYTLDDGKVNSYSCIDKGYATGYIASNSARLTSDSTFISDCSFSCSSPGGGIPSSLTVSIDARDSAMLSEEGSAQSVSTRILLRNY